MYYEVNLKLRSYNTSYCLIEVVTKAGLTVETIIVKKQRFLSKIGTKHIETADKLKVLINIII